MRLSYLFEATILEYTPEQEAEQAKWRKPAFQIKYPGRLKPKVKPKPQPEVPKADAPETKVP